MSEGTTPDLTAKQPAQGLPTVIQLQNIQDTVRGTMVAGAEQRAPFPLPEIPGLKLISLVGHGGMGIVWLAEQLSTGRKVAVKQIRGGGSLTGEPMQRARFQREIELAARLEHPNIARVFNGGEYEDCPYCVMEYVEGRQLTDFAKASELKRDDILRLMEKIADAVDHAHRRGVLHRDLKPGNILVTDGGEPKLLDFGLARAMDGTHQTMTIDGALAGTPAYMSPEQARGDTRSIDTRSDIYSLGVIFYELLTNRHPYPVDGPIERVLANVCAAEVTRPRSWNRSIPPDLEMLLLRSLAAQPSARYSSASELAEDIRRFLRREPLIAGRTSTAYFLRKWASRNRAACLAAATLVATATSATAYHWRTIGIEKDAALLAEKQALEEMGRALLSAIEESLQRGNYKGALESIEKAEKSGSVDPGILLFHRFEAMEGLGDFGLHYMILSTDRDGLTPEQAARLDYWKGALLLNDGKQEKAFSLLKRALESGELPEVETALARANLSETVAEAIVHFTEAANLAPWRAVTQRNLLWTLILTGRVDEAKARLQICYLLFPDDASFRGMEALMEAFRGNKDAALRIAREMKDDQSGVKKFLLGGVEPIANLSNNAVNAACGIKAEFMVMDLLALLKTMANFKALSTLSRTAPSVDTGPAMLRSLGGIKDAILALQTRDSRKKREKLRLALEKSDDAFVWMVLAEVEMVLGNYEEALSIAKNARSLPSVFSRMNEAAISMEGLMEVQIRIRDGDPSRLIRANTAFKEFYKTDVPKDASRVLVAGVAINVGDLLFARQVAAAMPKESIDWLSAHARIEWADGNRDKALSLAEKGTARFPRDGRFQKMLQEWRAPTPSVADPSSEPD